MGDVITMVRRIECDGCDLVEELREPEGKRTAGNWAAVHFDESGPPRMYAVDATERPLPGRVYCPNCIERALAKLDELRPEFERSKGGEAPRGWP